MSAIFTARQVGQDVRQSRKQLGLTQCQLAERSGVSERSIVSLELGDATGIRLDKLLKVLSALGLSMTIQAEEDKPKAPRPAPVREEQTKTPTGVPIADGPVLAFLQQAQQACPLMSIPLDRGSPWYPSS